jgi:hypothetical protein
MTWADEIDLEAFAHEAITVAATSLGLTAATWQNPTTGSAAKMAVIDCETANVRYRVDGTDPTATTGHPLNAGSQMKVWGAADLAVIEFIREGATSATLRVTYYR